MNAPRHNSDTRALRVAGAALVCALAVGFSTAAFADVHGWRNQGARHWDHRELHGHRPSAPVHGFGEGNWRDHDARHWERREQDWRRPPAPVHGFGEHDWHDGARRNWQPRDYWRHEDHFSLAPHHREVFYGGARYYFSAGLWYRHFGARYVVVAPPFGIVIPVLPPYYTTFWVGGIPYYYANNVYYVQGPQGYTVVQPPSGAQVIEQGPADAAQPPANGVTELGPVVPPDGASQIAGAGGTLFVYPRQNQTADQQAQDREACEQWASSQTSADNADDFRRALEACLDGRGYTVR